MILKDLISPPIVSRIYAPNRTALKDIIVNDEETTLNLYDLGILKTRPPFSFQFEVARKIAEKVNNELNLETPLFPAETIETSAGEKAFLIQPFSSSIEAEARWIYRQDLAFLLLYRGEIGELTAPVFFDYVVNYLIRKQVNVNYEGGVFNVPIVNIVYNSQVQIDGATSADGFINSTLLESEQLPETSAIIYARRFFQCY